MGICLPAVGTVAHAVALSLIAATLASAAGFVTPGSSRGTDSIIVTVVGFACAGGDNSRIKAVREALTDAKKKGREYAVSEIESKTTLESGVPRLDLMSAYASGTIREIGTATQTWYQDPVQGDCCELQIQLEAIPSAEELNKMTAKISPDDSNTPMTVQVWTDRKVYKEGDKFRVYLKANKSFYGTVVYQDASGAKLQLLPNPYRKQNFFAGNTLYELPDADDKYELVVTPPLGSAKITVYARNNPLRELSMKPAGKVHMVTGSQRRNAMRTRSIKFSSKGGTAGTPSPDEFFEANTELTTGR